jgi:dissimilatory sulfite reductase (desulfoviridin) alpha/beta subunit
MRKLCDIGDKYAEGYVRFTIRSNIEYMVADGSKVEPLIAALEKEGFVVGGTKNSVAMNDGRVDRGVQKLEHAQPRSYHNLMLPDQLWWPG